MDQKRPVDNKEQRTAGVLALIFIAVITAGAMVSIVLLSFSGIWVEPPVIVPDVLNSVTLLGIGAIAGVLGSRDKE